MSAFDAKAWLAGFMALGGGWAVRRDSGQILLGFVVGGRRALVSEMIDQLYNDAGRADAVFAEIRAHREAA